MMRALVVMFFAWLPYGSARAAEFDCKTTEKPAERIICDYAVLNMQYERIAEEQKTYLDKGALSIEFLTEWRRARDACVDVPCMDRVFAVWKEHAKSLDLASNPAEKLGSAPKLDQAPGVTAPGVTKASQEQDGRRTVNPASLSTSTPKVKPSPLPEGASSGFGSTVIWVIGGLIVFLILSSLGKGRRPGKSVSPPSTSKAGGTKSRELKSTREIYLQDAWPTRSDMSRNKAFKNCCTCEYWGGERQPSVSGQKVKFMPESTGRCLLPPGHRRTSPNEHCPKWELWKPLS